MSFFKENTCFQLNVIKDRDERNKIYIFAEVLSDFDNKSVLVDNEKKAYMHLTSSMLSAESMKLDKSVKLLEALGFAAQGAHGKAKVIFQVLQGFAYTEQARSLCCGDLQLCVE